MPRRIDVDTDMKILTDLGLGVKSKDIAVKYGVSPAYVSKVKRGKKKLDIHVPEPIRFTNEDFEAYDHDLQGVIEFIDQSRVLVDHSQIINYLEKKVKDSIIQTKMYMEILKFYKRGE